MPERILPGLGLRAFYEPGQRNWGESISEDLRLVSALVQARALSRSTSLPTSGSLGDIYIVPGAAATNANNIALWDGTPGAQRLGFILRQSPVGSSGSSMKSCECALPGRLGSIFRASVLCRSAR